jgi:hypothetical protein
MRITRPLPALAATLCSILALVPVAQAKFGMS